MRIQSNDTNRRPHRIKNGTTRNCSLQGMSVKKLRRNRPGQSRCAIVVSFATLTVVLRDICISALTGVKQ